MYETIYIFEKVLNMFKVCLDSVVFCLFLRRIFYDAFFYSISTSLLPFLCASVWDWYKIKHLGLHNAVRPIMKPSFIYVCWEGLE